MTHWVTNYLPQLYGAPANPSTFFGGRVEEVLCNSKPPVLE